MGKLVWLKLIRGTVLELPGLTDCGRQPLVFRVPTLIKRCVTQDVFNHPFVQRYLAQGMLVVDQIASPVPAATKPTVAIPVVAAVAAPTPATVALVEAPLPLAVALTEPAPAPEAASAESAPLETEEAEATPEATPSEVSEGLSASLETADPSPEPLPSMNAEMSKPYTDTPRRRRRG
jgi:hypothetical protein